MNCFCFQTTDSGSAALAFTGVARRVRLDMTFESDRAKLAEFPRWKFLIGKKRPTDQTTEPATMLNN